MNLAAAINLHPQLRQSAGPSGQHFELSGDSVFPRIDEQGLCWVPQSFDAENSDVSSPEWIDYRDPDSELIRESCEIDFREECGRPLSWQMVECNADISDIAFHHPHREGPPRTLPVLFVIPV